MRSFLVRKNFVTKFKVPTLPLPLIRTFIHSIKAAANGDQKLANTYFLFVFIYSKTLRPIKCFPPNT